MIDYHCHILPEVDDGASSVQESLAMLRQSYHHGVKIMVSTSHFYPDEEEPKAFLSRRNAAYLRLKEAMKQKGELCLSFNYGNGGASSCKNTVKASSMLLFDAPIDHYIQIPTSAIGVLNDLVGGVPVTIQEDLTAADPAFTEGSTIHLTGAQAERFVRARMGLENDTNLARMARQRQYMDSFQVQARKAINSDSQFVMKLLEKMSEYLQSDMTAQQLSELVTRLDQGEIAPICAAEGELKLGEEYYEFYVDKASLWELVRAAYCGE